MGSGYAKKKKQARMMQEQFGALAEQMKNTKVSGTAANGLVQVEINGEHEVLKFTIDPQCVDPEDVEGLEDLVKLAFNNATKKLSEQSMSGLGGMGGLPSIPGLGL